MQRKYPEAPLVGVGAILLDRDRVLLVRRGHEPMKDCWSIPGGLVELGEPLVEALRREALEETGLSVEPLALVELLDRIDRDSDGRIRYHYIVADYLCRVAGGTARAGDDAVELRWAGPSDWTALHLDSVTLRILEAALQLARAHPE